jgi:hypothetical protein
VFQGVNAICGGNGDSCTVVEADPVPCDTICSTAGTECTAASKIPLGGSHCSAGEAIDCSETAGAQASYVKCDCRLTCGSAPACLPGWHCVEGECLSN